MGVVKSDKLGCCEKTNGLIVAMRALGFKWRNQQLDV